MPRPRRWAADEVAFMEESYPTMTNDELAEAVAERFGVPCRASQVKTFGDRHRLRKDPGVRSRAIREAARRRGCPWDDERDGWLRGFAPGHSEREITASFEARFGVSLTRGQLKSRLHMLGIHQDVNKGRFQPGKAAWNAGIPWDEWMPEASRGAVRRTQFKPGEVNGRAAQLVMPLGSERVTKDGYVEVKVAERSSGRRAHDNWVPKARLVWEREHGPVPEGSMVVFCDGDARNFDPANLALETRAEHAVIQRARIAYCDRESHDVAVAVARLKSAARRAERRQA